MSDYHIRAHTKSTNVRVFNFKKTTTHTLLRLLWHVAPGLSRWLIVRQFFAPPAYRTNTREEACLKKGRSFQITIHNKTLHGWKWGRGPAILLVHGWGGRGIQFHHFVEPLIEAGYTAIALDGPAHGASSGRITSYFEFTDVIRTLLSRDKEFDIKGIVSHSFGAAAVINALAKEELTRNTVCIAPPLRIQEILFHTFAHFGVPEHIYKSVLKKFENHFGYDLKADNPHRLLHQVSGPILIVHDRKDPVAPFVDSFKQARKHDHITLAETRGLGHKKILTDKKVIKTCLDHLSNIPTSPTVKKGE